MMRPFPRRLASPRFRQSLGHGVLALVLLSPLFIVLVDHHGAERIPGHEHAAPAGRSFSGHAHAFERNHVHAPAGAPLPLETTAFVAARPVAVLGLALIDHLGLLPVVWLAAAAAASRAAIARVPRRDDQITLRPPTPPPTVA